MFALIPLTLSVIICTTPLDDSKPAPIAVDPQPPGGSLHISVRDMLLQRMVEKALKDNIRFIWDQDSVDWDGYIALLLCHFSTPSNAHLIIESKTYFEDGCHYIRKVPNGHLSHPLPKKVVTKLPAIGTFTYSLKAESLCHHIENNRQSSYGESHVQLFVEFARHGGNSFTRGIVPNTEFVVFNQGNHRWSYHPFWGEMTRNLVRGESKNKPE